VSSIERKKQRSKISCYCPFKLRQAVEEKKFSFFWATFSDYVNVWRIHGINLCTFAEDAELYKSSGKFARPCIHRKWRKKSYIYITENMWNETVRILRTCKKNPSLFAEKQKYVELEYLGEFETNNGKKYFNWLIKSPDGFFWQNSANSKLIMEKNILID
jgi:hypothetical protein